MSPVLRDALRRRGFEPDDCPYEPILPEWEDLPIVHAIREAERETGIPYENPTPVGD